MNVFRCTPDRSLDRYYLRTCAIYKLLKHGHINKEEAKALARRPIRGTYAKGDRLDGTIEIWLAGPLKHRAELAELTALASAGAVAFDTETQRFVRT